MRITHARALSWVAHWILSTRRLDNQKRKKGCVGARNERTFMSRGNRLWLNRYSFISHHGVVWTLHASKLLKSRCDWCVEWCFYTPPPPPKKNKKTPARNSEDCNLMLLRLTPNALYYVWMLGLGEKKKFKSIVRIEELGTNYVVVACKAHLILGFPAHTELTWLSFTSLLF